MIRLATTLSRLAVSVVAVRFCRLADTIDLEYPGPYPPGSVGAAWKAMADRLRTLAAEMTRP